MIAGCRPEGARGLSREDGLHPRAGQLLLYLNVEHRPTPLLWVMLQVTDKQSPKEAPRWIHVKDCGNQENVVGILMEQGNEKVCDCV